MHGLSLFERALARLLVVFLVAGVVLIGGAAWAGSQGSMGGLALAVMGGIVLVPGIGLAWIFHEMDREHAVAMKKLDNRPYFMVGEGGKNGPENRGCHRGWRLYV